MLGYLILLDTKEDKLKFEELYVTYRPIMFYAANRILKDAYLSEDAVHQAFLRVMDHLDKVSGSNCYKTKKFIIVVTENIAIDLYRKKEREKTSPLDEEELYVDEIFEGENDIETLILRLPINYSIVLRLKFGQGYQDKEIAYILQISAENVRKRISRGKKKLRQLMEEEGVVL